MVTSWLYCPGTIRNEILSVDFEWIKYKTNCTFSGPGYFARIAIKRVGLWSARVIICSSAN